MEIFSFINFDIIFHKAFVLLTRNHLQQRNSQFNGFEMIKILSNLPTKFIDKQTSFISNYCLKLSLHQNLEFNNDPNTIAMHQAEVYKSYNNLSKLFMLSGSMRSSMKLFTRSLQYPNRKSPNVTKENIPIIFRFLQQMI